MEYFVVLLFIIAMIGLGFLLGYSRGIMESIDDRFAEKTILLLDAAELDEMIYDGCAKQWLRFKNEKENNNA